MPIYEYKCTKCEKVFERIVSVADSSKAVFCDCSPKAKAKKIISAPSFRLEGWVGMRLTLRQVIKNLVQSEDKSKKTNKETKKSDNSKTLKRLINFLNMKRTQIKNISAQEIDSTFIISGW